MRSHSTPKESAAHATRPFFAQSVESTTNASPFFAPTYAGKAPDLQAEAEPAEKDVQLQMKGLAAAAANFPVATQPPVDEPPRELVQTKMTIGSPGDKFEREADMVADRVVQRMESGEGRKEGSQPIQAKCTACHDVQASRRLMGGGPIIQTKRKMGPVVDSFEPESEAKADDVVVRMPAGAMSPVGVSSLHTKCACCPEEEPLQRQLKDGEVIEDTTVPDKLLQAGGDGSMDVPRSLQQRIETGTANGSTMHSALQDQLESAFGADFSGVRIHTGSKAERLSRDLRARAFTFGHDLFFSAGEYRPDTRDGRHLLAHELTHVVQQNGGVSRARLGAEAAGEVQRTVQQSMSAGLIRLRPAPGSRCASSGATKSVRRQSNPRTAPQLTDPITGADLAGFGFSAIGPEFTGVPQEVDIRQVLGEAGVADAKALHESSPQSFKLKGGPVYFAYMHPTLGVVARAFASVFNPGQKDPVYSVYAYIDNTDSTKYRPVGGTGEKRKPAVVLDVMSGAPALRFTDLYAGLRLVGARVAEIPGKHPSAEPGLGIAIAKVQRDVGALRSSVTSTAAQMQTVETALQLLDWVDYDVTLVDQQRAKLVAEKAPTRSIDALREKYWKVLEKLLQPDASAAYEEAQSWAERLPIDVMLDALKSHGQLNVGLLTASDVLVAWVDNLRGKLDALYDLRRQLAANPGDAKLTKQVQDEAAFLAAAVRGIQLYAQRLVAFEQFIKSKPGVLDTPLIDAMNRLRDRVDAIKDAYDKHDTVDLKARVDSLEADENVNTFYRALPAAMQVTRLIGKIGVTTLAAMATGGVGGLLTGGARAAATGITMRGTLTFLGTAVLEAATFTAVNAAASKLLFDEKISFGSLLKDFAWNIGLFSVLRAVSGVSNIALRAAELQALSAPVQLVAGFPFAHGWGVLRFRVEQNRWPTKAELDQMTAESVIMMAAIAVGSKGVQRYIEARKTATSLSFLYRQYGWRFEALETLRTDLGEAVKNAEASGKGSDPAELDAAKAKAKTIEEKFQQLLKDVLADKRIQIPKIREEFNALREAVPDVAAEIISETLGIPKEVGVRRLQKTNYSYANGKTSALETALSGQYTIQKSADPMTGLKTLTATSPKAPTLVFQERTAGVLDIDTSAYDVQKMILVDLSLTDPDAQKMLWRMLSENRIAKDARQATTTTRKQIKDLTTKAGKSAEEVLRDLHKTGRLRSTAPKPIVDTADRLDTAGILRSAEWLEARGTDNQKGVVGEWLAKETVAPAPGSRVLRRVTIYADLFEDAAGTVPAKDIDGHPRANATAAETDLIYARDVSGAVEVDMAISVKTSGEKGMAKSAKAQNENFEAVLTAKPGDLVKMQLADGPRFARVTKITALEGAATIYLTGKLKPSANTGTETVGPRGAAGFTKTLGLEKGAISTVADVLNETQLVRSGEY